jgi:hypothetical protein
MKDWNRMMVGRIGESIFADMAREAGFEIEQIGQEWKGRDEGAPDFRVWNGEQSMTVEVKVRTFNDESRNIFDFSEVNKMAEKPDFLVVFRHYRKNSYGNPGLYLCCFKFDRATGIWLYPRESVNSDGVIEIVELQAPEQMNLRNVYVKSSQRFLNIIPNEDIRKTAERVLLLIT